MDGGPAHWGGGGNDPRPPKLNPAYTELLVEEKWSVSNCGALGLVIHRSVSTECSDRGPPSAAECNSTVIVILLMT